MRTIDPATAAELTPHPPRDRRRGRIHMLALAGLLALLWAAGPRGVGFSVDEIALTTQLDALDDGSWDLAHPYPEIGEDGSFYPDHLAVLVEETGRFAPYPKHPLVPLLLLPVWQLGGRAAAELVVLGGLLAAAVAVSRVVRLVARPAAIPALWLVGVGSAVLVHGFVLWMHAWGLALAAVSVECAIRLVERRPRSAVVPVIVLTAVVPALTLVRSEGGLAGLGLAVGLGVAAVIDRRRGLAAVGVALAALTVAAVVGERLWVDHLVGETRSLAATEPVGFFQGRLLGSYPVFLSAATDPGTSVARLVAICLLASGLWRWRRGGIADRELRVLAVTATTAFVAAVLLLPPRPVPGLVPGLPLLVLPLLLRGSLARPLTALLGTAAATYLVLIAATTHASGAGSDWGGRYALLVVPMLAPMVANRLIDLPAKLSGGTGRVVLACLVATAAVAGPSAYLALRRSAATTSEVAEIIVTESSTVRPSPDTGLPVVVTPSPALGRVLAEHRDSLTPLTEQRPERLPLLFQRLAGRGVDEVLVVGAGVLGNEEWLDRIEGWEAAAGHLSTPATGQLLVRRP